MNEIEELKKRNEKLSDALGFYTNIIFVLLLAVVVFGSYAILSGNFVFTIFIIVLNFILLFFTLLFVVKINMSK